MAGRTFEQTTPDGVQADTGAAVAWLRDAGCSSVFTVGFCFGGRHSWLAAASGHDLRGAIGFYGRPGPGSAMALPGRPSAPGSWTRRSSA